MERFSHSALRKKEWVSVFKQFLLWSILLIFWMTSAQASEVRVLSFNIWGMPAIFGGGGKKGQNRHDVIGQHLKNYDIVAIQEAWVKRTKTVVEDASFPYVSYGKNPYRLICGSGLVTLSRFPIIESEFRQFRKCTGIDCFADKGMLRTRIKLPDETWLDVYNLHLNAGNKIFSKTDWLGRRVRLHQIEELAKWVKEVSEGDRYLILGDFNAPEGSVEQIKLSSLLNASDAYRVENPNWHPNEEIAKGHTYSYEKNTWIPAVMDKISPSGRIDYIWAGGFAPSDILHSQVTLDVPIEDEQSPVEGKHLSDHFGVSASIRYSSF